MYEHPQNLNKIHWGKTGFYTTKKVRPERALLWEKRGGMFSAVSVEGASSALLSGQAGMFL